MDHTGIGKAGHHPTQQQGETHQMDEHLLKKKKKTLHDYQVESMLILFCSSLGCSNFTEILVKDHSLLILNKISKQFSFLFSPRLSILLYN